MTAPPGPVSRDSNGRRQMRMGPAPFASFEDLSDELDSPEDKSSVIRLPGIHEDPITPGSSCADVTESELTITGISLIGANSSSITATSLSTSDATVAGLTAAKLTPCTPRIDISRASSSSHHEDSKDSSPENHEKLGLGFREEGTLDLRSSTEELDFQDPSEVEKQKAQQKSRPPSPLVFICDSNFDRQRKDSQTSEICLLSISGLTIPGRTSRLSSIGSQGSEHSRISTTSHLSVMSGASGTSRSTSPHKMLLETSFCGSKPNLSEIAQGPNAETKDGDVLEKVLLARKHDPREAILAEGIKIETPRTSSAPNTDVPVKKPLRTIPKPPRASLEKKAASTGATSKPPKPLEKPIPPERNKYKDVPKIIETKPEVPEQVNNQGNLKPGETFKSETGVEYTFIPLKGPLPPRDKISNSNLLSTTKKKSSRDSQNSATKNTKSSTSTSKNKSASSKQSTSKQQSSKTVANKPQSKSASTSGSSQNRNQSEPEYIWIKLKPDHMYGDSESSSSTIKQESVQKKPDSLDLKMNEYSRSKSADVSSSKNLYQTDIQRSDFNRPSSALGKNIDRYGMSPTIYSVQQNEPLVPEQLTQSPSLSRRNSLFKSRETMSPDSSTPTGSYKKKPEFSSTLAGDNLRDKRRSRSKSRERDWSPAMSSSESIDGKQKQKNSVFSIFKSKKTPTKSKPTDNTSSSENLKFAEGIGSVEFTFKDQKPKLKYHENLLEGDSIRIPLHSPSEYESRTLTRDNVNKVESEPVSETKAEISRRSSVEKSSVPQTPDRSLKHNTSTSSENIVFSTKLGSNDEIFTTKLPKKPQPVENFRQEIVEKTSSEIIKGITTLPSSIIKNGDIKQSISSSASKETLKELVKRKNSEPSAKKLPTPTEPPVKPERVSLKPSTSSTDTEKTVKSVEDSGNANKTSKIQSLTEPTNRISVMSDTSNRNSVASTTTANEEETSENSEQDSEVEHITKKKKADKSLEKGKSEESEEANTDDHERKTLVFQEESFEDELPYVPTTLPLEKPVAVPIVPIKQRSAIEMKTCPIDRPRSTTPINPSCIDDYCGDAPKVTAKTRVAASAEKLKISLPREDTMERIQRLKSPRKSGTNPKAWHEFAEKGISQGHQMAKGNCGPNRQNASSEEEAPPPLPPRSTPKEPAKQWINFEEIPEKHKAPKRIQTIPSRGHIEVSSDVLAATTTQPENVVYNYVNPEDCQCECHEAALKSAVTQEEAEIPLLQEEDSSDDTIKNVYTTRNTTPKTKR